MVAFAIGLLIRGYALPATGIDIAGLYIPHGMMIGAGVIALFQVGKMVFARHGDAKTQTEKARTGPHALRYSLGLGVFGYLAITVFLAVGTGIYSGMSVGMLIAFILYATAAAFIHELIVGIAAMHSGWFPAFAVALITLLIGILLGFAPEALVVLTGFTAATGPAFADMGYDLKTGQILRADESRAFEMEGRRQQLIAAMLGFAVAIIVVSLSYKLFFANNQTAPINAAYVAAIKAGISSQTAWNLFVWAVPGAFLQWLGGSRRQLGVLFATGLLIPSPMAGWMVAAGLLVRGHDECSTVAASI